LQPYLSSNSFITYSPNGAGCARKHIRPGRSEALFVLRYLLSVLKAVAFTYGEGLHTVGITLGLSSEPDMLSGCLRH
jgi:hypothetical protein